MRYYRNFDLTNYNSFHLYSIAKKIWFPETVKELEALIKELKGTDYNILSGGTNVLLAPKIDKIICLQKMGKGFMVLNNNEILVSASYSTNSFVNRITRRMKLSGLEGLIGIPGLLGGAIVMNAGSGDYSISDCLIGCEVINSNGKRSFKVKKDLQFRRRYSILQDTKEIITVAMFQFKENIIDQTNIITKTIEYRKNMPKDYSAGGIFINWHTLKLYKKELIGLKVGDAEVSKSINIIVNKGKATFDDIMGLIKKIKNIVNKKLKLEIKIME